MLPIPDCLSSSSRPFSSRNIIVNDSSSMGNVNVVHFNVETDSSRFQCDFKVFAPSECGEGQPNDGQITRDRVCSNTASTARSSKCDHSANRNSRATRIQKWCVIETIIISLRTEPHAQPLLTVGNPQSLWHHNTVIIRSGRRSVSNSKHCDSKNVFLLKRS